MAIVPSGLKASELEAQNSANVLTVAWFSMCQEIQLVRKKFKTAVA